MAEEVGGIYYDVDANTGDLIDSVKTVEKSNKRIEKSIDGVSTRLNKTTAAVKGASKGVGRFGRTAGQAGIQLQQLVGQIQGGQGAMLALSQQGADLGFVLGAPLAGAIIGIGASIAGFMLPSLFDATTAMEDLEKATEAVGDAVQKTKDGVPELTDEIRELAKVSETAAKAQLAQEIVDAQNVLNKSAKAIRDDAEDIGASLLSASEVASRYADGVDAAARDAALSLARYDYNVDLRPLDFALSELNKKFGLNRDQAFEFLTALNKVNKESSPENIQNLQNLLGRLAEDTNFANAELNEFISGLSKAFSEARNAGDIMEFATKTMGEFGLEIEKTTEKAKKLEQAAISQSNAIEKMISSLKDEAQVLGQTDRERSIYIATMEGATPAQIAQINATYDVIEAKKEEIEAENKATREKEKARQELQKTKASFKDFQSSLEAQILELVDAEMAFESYIEQQRKLAIEAGFSADQIENQIRKLRELKEEQKLQAKKERFTTELGTGLGATTEQGIQFNRDQELQKLKEAKELELVTEQEYQLRRVNIILDAEKQIRDAQKKTKDEQLLNWESIETQATGALASIAVGAQSGREAMRSLAISIAQQAVGALLKLAFTSKSVEQGNVVSANIAGAAITAAYTPAATMANIASFGGAGYAAAASAPIAAAAHQAISLGGGRLYGGGVSPDKLYPVTENGKPELFQSGNKSYLLPGRNGNVVSNKDMQNGGASANITINVMNNASGASVDARSRTEGQGVTAREVIDIFVSDMDSRGRTHSAVTRTTTANNKTG